MKKKILKVIFCTSYTLAIVLAIAFIVIMVMSWFATQELVSTNPWVLVGPFSIVVKHWAKRLLMPSVIFAVLGYVLQRINKINTQR